jgi:hypothetical protein
MGMDVMGSVGLMEECRQKGKGMVGMYVTLSLGGAEIMTLRCVKSEGLSPKLHVGNTRFYRKKHSQALYRVPCIKQ